MTKDEINIKVRQALKILLYLFEVETNNRYKGVINNLHINTYGDNDNNGGDVHFELVIYFNVDEPDATALGRALRDVDKDVYEALSKYKLSSNIEVVRRGEELTDDVFNMLESCSFVFGYDMDGSGYDARVIFRNDLNFYFDEGD